MSPSQIRAEAELALFYYRSAQGRRSYARARDRGVPRQARLAFIVMRATGIARGEDLEPVVEELDRLIMAVPAEVA
ncbi:MAG TPA: hypothetical protein P5142_00270 [Spirochaetia bacterium]|nr:hypothetical protein [Spirochaetia bacterium]